METTKTTLSKNFQNAQIKWMEDMLINKKQLCDVIFVAGSEKEKLYGLRALLANISPVFKAQLFGNFRESSLDEVIEYPTISSSVFKCILRVSFGLDPQITEHTAVGLIEASNMLQIEPLQRECQYFLQHCINEKNVLFLLNSAYCLNSLDKKLYLKCRKIILSSNSYSILLNEGFYSLHPDLIIDIISTNDFKAKEENIWNSCLKWAQNVIKKSLKFPKKPKHVLQRLKTDNHNDDDNKENKENDNKDDDDDDDEEEDDEFDLNGNNYYYKQRENEELNIEYILSPIVPYIRMPLMGKEFFIENVCKYLNREQSESVLIHFILDKATIFNHCQRKTFLSFKVILANKQFDKAQKLPDLNAESLWPSKPINDINDYQWLIIDIMFIGVIQKIELKNKYSDKDTLKSFKLQISSNQEKYNKKDNNDNWIDVQSFQSKMSSNWQEFNVNINNIQNRKSRYWRLVLMDTYGGYTCVNHLKLTCFKHL